MPPSRHAVTLVAALLLAGVAGCTSQDPPPSPEVGRARSAASSEPTAATPRALAVPPVTPDEISRVVYTARTHTMDRAVRRAARTGQQYVLEAACTSATPGLVVSYDVLSSRPDSNTPVASGDLPCDGSPLSMSTELPATPVQITLGPGLTGVTSAYAVIRPSA